MSEIVETEQTSVKDKKANMIANMGESRWQEISDPSLLDQTPLVSINMIAYNQERIIAQAIEGVLEQKTTFAFELVIGEDCSTDGTRDIVLDYQKQHPDIIRVITSDKNVGTGDNWHRVNENCRGKYIAFCEGDDYWTDPRKLQKQVDFMEANTDCSAVFHAAGRFYEDKADTCSFRRLKRTPRNQRFTIKDAIKEVAGNYATASLLCRSEHPKDLPEFFYRAPVGDFPLMLVLAVRGNIGYIDEPMSVYRVAAEGSWTTDMRRDRIRRRKHYADIMAVYKEFDSWTGNEYWGYVLFSKVTYAIRICWVEVKSLIKSVVFAKR